MIYNTCYIAPVLFNIACYRVLLFSIAKVQYSQGVIWQIWILYSSDPRFQMVTNLFKIGSMSQERDSLLLTRWPSWLGKSSPSCPGQQWAIMNPILPIIDLVIICNNEPIITVIIVNNGNAIIGNNDVMTR